MVLSDSPTADLDGPAPVGARLLGTLAGAALLVGCAGAPAPAAPPSEPPPPPAACLLDTGALRVATGVAWTADSTTATDIRCVYDPAGGTGADFVVVDVAPPGIPVPPLDELAAVCEDGTRVPAGDGFGCRLAGGGVFAATVRDGALVTLAAATVPAATTADRLAAALAGQLTPR